MGLTFSQGPAYADPYGSDSDSDDSEGSSADFGGETVTGTDSSTIGRGPSSSSSSSSPTSSSAASSSATRPRTPRRYCSRHSRALFRHLRRSEFQSAIDLLSSRRHVADTPAVLASNCDGKSLRLPLHAAVRNYRADPPQQLIRALLAANPDAAAAADADGNTALHYACDAACNQQVFRAVLEAHPPAALMRNNRGEVPLHMADTKFATVELCQRFPSALSAIDQGGRTPLFLFCDLLIRHMTVGGGMCGVIKAEVGPHTLDDSASVVFHKQCPPYNSITLQDVWSAVATMVRSTSMGTVPTLHAALRYGVCPTAYPRLVARIYPDQVRRADCWGDLPLHIAARALMAPGGGKGECRNKVPAADGNGTDKDCACCGCQLRSHEGGGGDEDRDKGGDTKVPNRSDGKIEKRGEENIEESNVGEVERLPCEQKPYWGGWAARLRVDEMHDLRSRRRGRRRGTDRAEEVVRELLRTYPEAAGRRDGFGRLPLQCASVGGSMTWGGGAGRMLEAHPGALHVGGWGRRRIPKEGAGRDGTKTGPFAVARSAFSLSSSLSAGRPNSLLSDKEIVPAGKENKPPKVERKRKSSSFSCQSPSSRGRAHSKHNRDRTSGDRSHICDIPRDDDISDRLDDRLLPQILSKVGRDCKVGTMFVILQGRPDLVRGGVALRRSGRKRRRRA